MFYCFWNRNILSGLSGAAEVVKYIETESVEALRPVLMPKSDIPQGTILEPEHFQFAELPGHRIPPSAVSNFEEIKRPESKRLNSSPAPITSRISYTC